MTNNELSYKDYLDKIDIQEVLVDAGYHHYRRDGLQYPSYVRLDSDGKRIRGDKFIVTANGMCCFGPPVQRCYNVIGFIKNHPDLFQDYTPGMSLDYLVNKVCRRILNEPQEERETHIFDPRKETKPFNIEDYKLHRFDDNDQASKNKFYPYFKPRGISRYTQSAFKDNILLATHTNEKGYQIINLSFPMYKPDNMDNVEGFEERGFPKKEGKAYKGMAKGSNASEALWIASPAGTPLSKAKDVLWFESAYDAMAYYQLHVKDNPKIKESVFVSTGGNPSVMQFRGVIREARYANHHLGFDNDSAGRQYVRNFITESQRINPLHKENVPTPMIQYVDSFRKEDSYIPTVEELLKPDQQQRNLLPKSISDKQGKEFEESLKQYLNIREDAVTNKIQYQRDAADEQYKDWNDELLGKKYLRDEEFSSSVDEDGNEIIVEQDLDHEEHHHYHR